LGNGYSFGGLSFSGMQTSSGVTKALEVWGAATGVFYIELVMNTVAEAIENEGVS